ncbi:MAG: PQQ-binding-like beta-propeller repeat protein [Lentisphaeria bacterium]|nr:PQQ-like beta-propeller repeat protein [Lentisphaeria bacterium]NQZ69447.1 PQQ-binding-like beta-propeller repeat protein [Lentisphaeria bacterium]
MKALTVVLVGLLAGTLYSQEVVGWRLDGDGVFPKSKPVTTWSESKNIKWLTKTKKWSNASPIPVKGKFYFCAEPDILICANIKTGKIVWEKANDYKSLSKAEAKKVGEMKMPRTHGDNGYSSPTPVSDGKLVYTLFGTGVLVAYDLKGKKKWDKFIMKSKAGWGHSMGPCLYKDTLIVQIEGQVFAYDTKTGKQKWTKAGRHSWGSSMVTEIDGKGIMITANGDVYAIADGKKVASGIGSLKYAVPVRHGDIVYFIENNAVAVQLPKKIDGDYKQVWKSKIQGKRHYGSSIITDKLIYAISRAGIFNVLETKTGKIVYEKLLENKGKTYRGNTFYASISLANKNLYVGNQNGQTHVIATGSEFKEIAVNELSGYRSSPLIIGNAIYIRAKKGLYCISK